MAKPLLSGGRDVEGPTGHRSVENVGVKIGTVRPDNRAEVGVDSDLGKASGLAQGGKDPFPTEDCVEIHFSLDAIGEAQEETVAA